MIPAASFATCAKGTQVSALSSSPSTSKTAKWLSSALTARL